MKPAAERAPATSVAPLWLPVGLALLGSAVLAALNIQSARAMAPSWGQDLAFFTQIVHSAATGGPWASPLLMEPQGFWQMVHTHLVLPLVVASYALLPRQETLLAWQGVFAGLTLWPAYRLAETAAAERSVAHPRSFAALASLSLLLLGPLVATGTCDFRPSVLFLPGVLGVFAAARAGRVPAALAWSLVALSGRQEASYLLAAAGLGLLMLPWGSLGETSPLRIRLLRAVQWRVGAAVLASAVVSFVLWVWLKPAMFFHFDPTQLAQAAPLAPGHLAARWDFAGRLARSGLSLGLLSPTGLIAGLPLAAQMLRDGREWTDLVGATAHYHAPWLAFALASALVGVTRWPRILGGPWVALPAMILANALAWPLPAPRTGPVELKRLTRQVGTQAAVAADYDTIHAVAGRDILWNTAQLYLPPDQRPYGWAGPWPITLDGIDLVICADDDPILDHAQAFRQVDEVVLGGRSHLLLRRSYSLDKPAR